MDESTQTIDIHRFRSLLQDISFQAIGDDLFIYDTVGHNTELDERILNLVRYPLRLDAYLAIFCVSGSLGVDINLKSFELSRNTLLINIPGNIIRLETPREQIQEGRFILIGMSKSFMSSVHFDFNKMFNESMSLLDNPCFHLDEAQFELARDYFTLGQRLMSSGFSNLREATGSLVSSMLYLLGGMWSRHLSDARLNPDRQSLRVKTIFDQFIALVTEYHNSERGMKFYADKLCLTPKYLSKLIKQASGRSAPEWIDSFVILEAKNMLKYSDIPIKAIVFQLHFPNQSVFYKFFKAHTGLTPSEYRNS